MCFVPMHFGCPNLSTFQFDFSDTFHLSPPAQSKLLPQAIDVSYFRANCNRFNIFNFTNNLEICLRTIPLFSHADKALSSEAFMSCRFIDNSSFSMAVTRLGLDRCCSRSNGVVGGKTCSTGSASYLLHGQSFLADGEDNHRARGGQVEVDAGPCVSRSRSPRASADWLRSTAGPLGGRWRDPHRAPEAGGHGHAAHQCTPLVSSGIRTKTGVVSASIEGHYGRIEGEGEVSAALGLQYDLARGPSANLGLNRASAQATLDGARLADTRETEIVLSLRYSF